MAKILIVDDEKDVCDEFKGILQEESHDVDVATNGKDALENIQDTEYDLVFLDVLMPHMEGREVFEAIRKLSRVPVAIMSGYLPPNKESEVMALGAIGCFKKPLDLKRVMDLIKFVESQKAE